MEQHKPTGPVVEEILQVLEPRGYHLVAFSAEPVKKKTHVHCVVHHPDGVELDALAALHRDLEPRLAELLENAGLPTEARIEFSSPGLERVFAGFHEFALFPGRRVAVLPRDASEWLHGTIKSADETSCTIQSEHGEERIFVPDTVVKARLNE